MSVILGFLGTIGAILFVAIAFGFCIMVHELGHFLAARWRGLHIDAFSIGFKRIWSKKINGIDYRIGCLPFGGYVEIPQVDASGEVPKTAEGVELERAKPLDRIITAFAGPLFNVIAGFALATIIWYVGMPQDSPEMNEIKIFSVEENSPEYEAGLRAGDTIVKLNGKNFHGTWSEFYSKIVFTIGDVTLDVKRGNEIHQVVYRPIDNPNAPYQLKHEKIAYPFFIPIIPLELKPQPDSAAAKAGIKSGDILVTVNGEPLVDFIKFILDIQYGNTLDLGIQRKGELINIKLTPEPIQEELGVERPATIGVLLSEEGNIVVHYVAQNSPAALGGMKNGDTILSVDGTTFRKQEQLIRYINASNDKELNVKVLRDGKTLELAITPKISVLHDIGTQIGSTSHPSPWKQFEGMISMTYKSLAGMLTNAANKAGLTEKTSTIKPRHMSGPVGIIEILYRSARTSLVTGIYFVVIISFALAIFNLLPLPVLDGGHIAFGLLEMIFGKPMPKSILGLLNVIFITFLIGLMVYVTFFDCRRLYYRYGPTPEIEEIEEQQPQQQSAPVENQQ